MEEKNKFIRNTGDFCKKERLIEFYRSQKFVDCTFIIDNVEIKAHKLILACSSPVFEKMFFGEMASNEIVLLDISLNEFNQVLEFIYTENINIYSVTEAWSLYYIANKYLIEGLIKVCLDYVRKNVTMSTLVLSYEYADMYEIEDIKRLCFKDIVNYINGVFACDYHMKPLTLYCILQQDLVINNFELLVRILEWAVNECNINKIDLSPTNVIDVLKQKNLLKFICKTWLLSLKCDYCSDAPISCQCLSDFIHETLVYLDSVPEWIIEPRMFLRCSKFVQNVCKCRKLFKISRRVVNLMEAGEFVSQISVNKRTILSGVLVSTEMNFSQEFYEGVIRIRVCEQNKNLVKPTILKDIFFSNSEKFLLLQYVATLDPDKIYEIRISYVNYSSELYDSSIICHYMNNELFNENKDCSVYFYDTFGSVVRGLAFYPA